MEAADERDAAAATGASSAPSRKDGFAPTITTHASPSAILLNMLRSSRDAPAFQKTRDLAACFLTALPRRPCSPETPGVCGALRRDCSVPTTLLLSAGQTLFALRGSAWLADPRADG